MNATGQIPSALIDGKWQHRQFTRVDQGVYENGVFNLLRSHNGDATDCGLCFGEPPTVVRAPTEVRVTLGVYERGCAFLFSFLAAGSATRATLAR